MVTAATADLALDNDSAPPSMPPIPNVREGKELIDATRPFAVEDRARSWFHVGETLGVLSLLLLTAGAAPWLALRVAAGVVAGLAVVRGFILLHDYLHGAILKNSPVARWVFELYGLYVLTPTSVWKQTHNYHHAHTAQIVGSHIGSYMMLTTEMWEKATPAQRRMYKITRHPMTMLFGYLTIFAWGMCVSPFLRDARRHRMGPVALALHLVTLATITWTLGWQVALTAHVLPLFVAFAAGSYLFYAQHNYPGVHVEPRETWSYTRAALESSSYMECGAVMRWFTGNIGYHHVHHLNPQVPFYRLPEAMEAIPELRNPVKTTLRPRDIAACLRLKLWDPSKNQMVPYP